MTENLFVSLQTSQRNSNGITAGIKESDPLRFDSNQRNEWNRKKSAPYEVTDRWNHITVRKTYRFQALMFGFGEQMLGQVFHLHLHRCQHHLNCKQCK